MLIVSFIFHNVKWTYRAPFQVLFLQNSQLEERISSRNEKVLLNFSSRFNRMVETNLKDFLFTTTAMFCAALMSWNLKKKTRYILMFSFRTFQSLTLCALSGHIRPVNGRAICTTYDVISLSDAKNLW